ncbi:MAG: membrane protein insertase YidC [Stackebrandtia sp.]
MTLHWLYIGISWVLLKWHALWSSFIPDRSIVGTTWTWLLAIVFLVVSLRVVMFPLFVKQIKSQRAMQKLQPQVKELQQKYKGDRETLQREMMELYRKEKANPLMGCLPLLLQAPVFISLLHVLRRIKPTNTNINEYNWTDGQWFSALEAHVFGAPIWANFMSTAGELNGAGDPIVVKVVSSLLVILMTVTTYFTSRQMILKTGWNDDPQQRMIQKMMLYGIPAMLLFSGFIFPIGVICYWVVNNAFSLGQQMWVLRKYPPPKVNGKDETKKVTAKPGTKKYDKQIEEVKAEQAEKKEQAKALAPKPGAKPAHKRKQTAGNAAQQLRQKQEQAKAKASNSNSNSSVKPTKKKGGATRGASK